ncbi:MAG: DUF3810 domain-containing protein [Clostridia bacterium]|nr:DUF3810 domain-containing protein [Clostridia bacterium]
MEQKDVKTEYGKRDWSSVTRLLPWILLLPLGILLPSFCAGKQDLFESYALNIYPQIKDAISSLTSLAPFSVAEVILYAAAIGVPLRILTRLIMLILKKTDPVRFVRMLVRLVIIAGAVWNLFYVTWGFNYFRAPLRDRLSVTVQARPTEELYDLTVELAVRASEVRKELCEDENGVFRYETGGYREKFAALPAAYAILSEQEPCFSGKVTPAKPVAWSEGLSWSGISGIYIGLTAEPNVNVDQIPLLTSSAAAHEMAHQLGMASENEAEFTGMMACICSSDPEIRYSGLANALILAGNALYRADPDLYSEARTHYSDAVIRDFRAHNAYWDAFEGPTEETVTQMNDSYLKHNAQESGVRSYGESVDLLLAYREKKNFLDAAKDF